MRSVRLTKAEARWAESWLEGAIRADHEVGDHKSVALGESLLTKLRAASEPAPSGVAAGPLEQALIDTARGKVVKLAGAGGAYGRVSRVATAAGATLEDAKVIGAWLARQGWLREPVTVITVVNKWADWLARARATAAPAGISEGLDGHVRQGAEAKRQVTTAGRRPPGLG